MKKEKEDIYFIDHSGFLLERENVCFLFDYYTGDIPIIDEKKELIVFVSHHHQDHYNPVIFEFLRSKRNVTFVMPKGMPIKKYAISYEEEGIDVFSHMCLMGKNTTQDLQLEKGEVLHITTMKSTDAGVAYLLTYQGSNYYHAGDLNLWLWEEQERQAKENMVRKYVAQMEKLKGMKIDAAFVPLDPRLGRYAFDGMLQFLVCTNTQKVYPMHFWGEYKIISRFLQKYPQYHDIVVPIRKSGEQFCCHDRFYTEETEIV